MTLSELSILSFLLLEGESSQKDIAERFNSSKTGTAILFNKLFSKRLILKQGKKYKADLLNPLVQKLNEFLLIASKDKGLVNLLNDLTALKVLSSISPNALITIKEIQQKTGLSKPTIFAKIKSLGESRLLDKTKAKPIEIRLVKKKRANILLQEIASDYLGNGNIKVDLDKLLDNLKAEPSILILIHYGSYVKGRQNEDSDIDIFTVVNYETDKVELKKKYPYPEVDLSLVSKKVFLSMLRTQPYFINQLRAGNIIKGKSIFTELIRHL